MKFTAISSERWLRYYVLLKETDVCLPEVNRYVNEEWTVLPKAAAITVGGMAGFVLGLKRYVLSIFWIFEIFSLLTLKYEIDQISLRSNSVLRRTSNWRESKCSLQWFIRSSSYFFPWIGHDGSLLLSPRGRWCCENGNRPFGAGMGGIQGV